MSAEPDPEVLADLALRRDSERDRTRARTARYDWSPPAIAGQWRCRNPQCRAWVPVSVDAFEAAAVFNAQLKRKGESPLDVDTLVMCDACRELTTGWVAKKRRDQVERMRAAIIELKQTQKPERQRELLEQLRIWHHPDVDGLENWLRERDKASGRGKARKEL